MSNFRKLFANLVDQQILTVDNYFSEGETKHRVIIFDSWITHKNLCDIFSASKLQVRSAIQNSVIDNGAVSDEELYDFADDKTLMDIITYVTKIERVLGTTNPNALRDSLRQQNTAAQREADEAAALAAKEEFNRKLVETAKNNVFPVRNRQERSGAYMLDGVEYCSLFTFNKIYNVRLLKNQIRDAAKAQHIVTKTAPRKQTAANSKPSTIYPTAFLLRCIEDAANLSVAA